jgi:sarcinarray family protein
MRRQCVRFPLVVLLCVVLFGSLSSAAECDYGFVSARVRLSDDVWTNATAHLKLQRGECFDVQVTVRTTTRLLAVFIMIHEFGTPVYQVFFGPTAINQVLENRGALPSNTTFTYVWSIQVRPDTIWINGLAPLEVFVQFNKNDTDERRIQYGVLTAYITNEHLENGSQVSQTKTVISSNASGEDAKKIGITLGVIIAAVICLFLAVYRYVR